MNAIDTNILVYAFDTAYPQKRKICSELLTEIFEGEKEGAVTNQILAEFANAVTQKIEKPLSRDETLAIIQTIINSPNWEVFDYTGETVAKALSSQQPFWDALITATLQENNVKEIITENTKDFKNTGLIVHNPLP